MGQLFAPRAFGSKKCVVMAFVVRPDTHSRFALWCAEASRNLGFLRGKVGWGEGSEQVHALTISLLKRTFA